MNIRRIFPMETNLRFRNLKDFVFQKEYAVNRTDEQPVYFYLDAATYNNLGDQAISLATEWFLDDEFGREHVRVVNEADTIGYIKSLKKQMHKEDVIVLGGGGNMGDLYPRYESLRRLVIKSFPDNKIVVFPQTIDYSSDAYGQKEFERAKRVYGAHKNLTLCAREEKTFEILEGFCKNVLLVPDIVLYLADKLSVSKDGSCECGICLREDKESLLDGKKREELLAGLKKRGIESEKITTKSPIEGNLLRFEDRKNALQSKIAEFAKFKFIITDRLHGMIFSILSNVPCIALDNSNHKVFGVHKVIKEWGNIDVIEVQYSDVFSILDKTNQIENAEVDTNLEENAFQGLIDSLKENYRDV